ncbi:PAS domain S-box-containing protein [Streptomyces sp. DvalAA-14]|uniref:SpoIIE family protein phosphatase n=1 Tax=unclassified Streptomyces TaxID=2593676 RepID=UPI00081BB75A|nr:MULTISPECIES: SpoIIE family protein phosphatase [unclassified Streptomyces]MYS24167.1 SpoIIE family protein phosphatase [Streptomyces sp. SID4948]SCE43248.1 PAS domain S-box-containing protein [Streptomyces sp. DvalAA-14]
MARGLAGGGTGHASVDFTASASGVAGPAVALVASDGTVLAWGDGCRRLLGYRAEDVVGRSVERLTRRPVQTLSWSSAPGAVGKRGSRHSAGAVVEARHRDGGVLRLTVEIVGTGGASGEDCWFVAVTGTADGDEAGEGQAGLLDRSPLAVAVWDSDMRLLWLNRASKELMGLPAAGNPGTSVPRVLRGFDRTSVELALREVLATREPVGNHVVRWVSPEDGREVVFSSSLFPLAPRDGTPPGICSVSLDITHTWERERLALLSRGAQRIGTTLDVMTTAQELADMAVPALADYVAVDLAEAVPLGEEPLARMDQGELGIPIFRRAGMASVHEGVPEAPYKVGEVVYVPPASPYLAALREGQSYLCPILESGPGTWVDQDPIRRQVIRDTGMHSVMTVPLKARGTLLGLVSFARNENVVPFSRNDLLLAEELAVQASLSLDNARRFTRERTAALTLRRSILPEELSGGAAVDLASRYLPSARHEGVGGDLMDAIELPEGRVALVIGDVVGHGIHAAASMGRLRTAIHTLAVLDQPPAELLDNLNKVAARLAQPDDQSTSGHPSITGASCLYAVYDPANGVCTLARAGHPPPILVTPDGRAAIPDTPVGPPLGIGAGPYESVDLELPDRTVIALFTDGLVETRQGDIDAGLDRLIAALQHPPGDLADLEELCARGITRMTARTPPEDDVALLVARTHTAHGNRATARA